MKNWKPILITFVAVLAVALIIYFAGKKAGKATLPQEVKLPSDTQNQNRQENPTFNPGPYTDAIYQDIYEVLGMHNKAPYVELLKLSNTELVAVYNDWNKRYYSKDKETIVQAIKGEWTIWNFESDIRMKSVVDRYNALGLA